MHIILTIIFYNFLVCSSIFAINLNTFDSLAPISSWRTNSKIQKILQSEEFYTASELHFLKGIKELNQQKHSYNSLSDLIENLNISLMLNLDPTTLTMKQLIYEHVVQYKINISLYNNIKDLYLEYSDNDYFKEYLYSILSYLSKSISITDMIAQGNSINNRINRETKQNRLIETLPIIKSYLETKTPYIYDIGASTGIETASMLFYLLEQKSQGQEYKPNIIMTDVNIYQYVLYDKENNIKVIYNAKKEISAIITSTDLYYLNDTLPQLKTLERSDIYTDFLNRITPEDQTSFFHDKENNLFIEKIKMIDASVLPLESNSFSIIQHDASQAFPKEYPKADVIRIMNLLQYFDIFTKKIIIKNLINQLNEQGIIILTINATLEDSNYLFILQKDNNKINLYSHPITKRKDKITISLKNIDTESMNKKISLHNILELFSYNSELHDINDIITQIQIANLAA